MVDTTTLDLRLLGALQCGFNEMQESYSMSQWLELQNICAHVCMHIGVSSSAAFPSQRQGSQQTCDPMPEFQLLAPMTSH